MRDRRLEREAHRAEHGVHAHRRRPQHLGRQAQHRELRRKPGRNELPGGRLVRHRCTLRAVSDAVISAAQAVAAEAAIGAKAAEAAAAEATAAAAEAAQVATAKAAAAKATAVKAAAAEAAAAVRTGGGAQPERRQLRLRRPLGHREAIELRVSRQHAGCTHHLKHCVGGAANRCMRVAHGRRLRAVRRERARVEALRLESRHLKGAARGLTRVRALAACPLPVAQQLHQLSCAVFEHRLQLACVAGQIPLGRRIGARRWRKALGAKLLRRPYWLPRWHKAHACTPIPGADGVEASGRVNVLGAWVRSRGLGAPLKVNAPVLPRGADGSVRYARRLACLCSADARGRLEGADACGSLEGADARRDRRGADGLGRLPQADGLWFVWGAKGLGCRRRGDAIGLVRRPDVCGCLRRAELYGFSGEPRALRFRSGSTAWHTSAF
eukprot:357597-Chlamydomonas_euryale.AAC.3